MQGTTITQVDIGDWMRIAALQEELVGATTEWGRIKGGLYDGDLALVVVPSLASIVSVYVVPRLIRNGRRRPPAKLFNSEDQSLAERNLKVNRDESEPHRVFIGKCKIEHGLHSFELRRKRVQRSLPKGLEEVEPFAEAVGVYGMDGMRKSLVLGTVDNIRSADFLTVFQKGDRVWVKTGTYIGKKGVLQSVEDGVVGHVGVEREGEKGDVIEVALDELRRVFNNGDHVRVIRGRHIGRWGIVVSFEGVTLRFNAYRAAEDKEIMVKEDHEVS